MWWGKTQMDAMSLFARQPGNDFFQPFLFSFCCLMFELFASLKQMLHFLCVTETFLLLLPAVRRAASSSWRRRSWNTLLESTSTDCFQPLFMSVGTSHVLIAGKQTSLWGDTELLCLDFLPLSLLFYHLVKVMISFSILTPSEVTLILLCFSA